MILANQKNNHNEAVTWPSIKCSKLTINTPERRHLRRVFNVNFEHISHLVLVFLLLTLGR